MKLTWFGTAGFSIETDYHTILIDPYFSRNPWAAPEQPVAPSDIQQADFIFISHGHFDHIHDVPEIASNTKAMVYCGRGVDDTLVRKGLNRELIHPVASDGQIFSFDGVQAQAFYSEHVRFDLWLLLKTLVPIHFRIPRYLPLMREYPKGQVLSWRFKVEGKVIHHFGSGGSPPEELERLGTQPTDILLVPLQGHTRINRIAHNYVKALKPEVVIPHHQDDFYPPISSMVDIQQFRELVEKSEHDTSIRVMAFNESLEF